MADNHSKEVRSMNMSHIRSENTKPEVIVRSFLHRNGFRFRKNDKRYPGKPDILLPKYKTAIYINGCFWHMHNCKNFVWPKSNTDYWINKLKNNKNRDKKYYKQMKKSGWNVMIIWECQINERRLVKLIKELRMNR
ncbi:MAG: DNA mismatch endonuclease Vsr [Thermoguttaceae bacterium]|nr:DNA mismatch endonuclease Vsr [Thermoguttaceae bacterium]